MFDRYYFYFRDISRWDTYQPFDPVPPVGDTILEETWILCLDEFQVKSCEEKHDTIIDILLIGCCTGGIVS